MEYFGYLNLLNGDRQFDIPLHSKDKVIYLLSKKLNLEQAEELYDYLPIELWAEYKFWFRDSDIIDEIVDTLLGKKFKLDYFDSLTYQTVLKKLNQGLIDLDVYNSFIIPIYSYILQHVYDKWKSINKKACDQKFENTFMIPSWLSYILPLFSGVGRSKFTHDSEYNLNPISFDARIKVYIYTITMNGIDYIIYINRKNLFEYYNFDKGQPKKSGTVIDDSIKKIICKLLDDAFSPKGLYYLLTIYFYYNKHGKENKIKTSLTHFIKETMPFIKKIKSNKINDIIRMMKIFSIIRISKYNRGRRPVGFFKSSSFIPSKSRRTYQLKMVDFFYYNYLNRDDGFYLLPEKICEESFVNDSLKYYLLIYLIEQWLNKKQHEHYYLIKDLIKICNIENYGVSIPYMEEFNRRGSEYNKKQFELLIETISYMKKMGYIGDWLYKPKNGKRIVDKSKIVIRPQWVDDLIAIPPPDWFLRFTYENEKDRLRFYKKEPPPKKYSGLDVKNLRKEMRMTQKKFSRLLGVSAVTLIKNEKMDYVTDYIQKKINKMLNSK